MCAHLKHKEPVLDGIAEVAVKDWGVLESDVLSEAGQRGIDIFWYSAWGRKKLVAARASRHSIYRVESSR